MPINPERGTFYVMFGEPSSGPTITAGTGAPAHVAPIASLYLRRDGSTATSLYVNEDGTGSGWSAK